MALPHFAQTPSKKSYPNPLGHGGFQKGQNFSVLILSYKRPEVSPFELRHEVHNRGDQRISRGVAGNAAIDTETLATEILGECAAQIGKGIFGPLGCRIASRRGLV